MPRRLIPLHAVPLLILLLLTGACGGRNDDTRPVISVSVGPQKYLLSRIVDSLYDINVLLPADADAETFDPSMQVMKSIGRSRLFFSVGASGFEEAAVNKIRASFPDLDIVDCSAGIDLIRDTHGEGEADPHVWGSVANAKIIAAAMLEGMVKADPANARRFEANYRRLAASLDSLDSRIRALTSSGPGAFAIFHPSLSYFARDYGLSQLPLEEHGREASPKQFARRLESIKSSPARILVMEPAIPDSRAENVIHDTGLRPVRVNLNSTQWPDQMLSLAQALSE